MEKLSSYENLNNDKSIFESCDKKVKISVEKYVIELR